MLTSKEAHQSVIEDIRASLRLTAQFAQDAELAKAAAEILTRLERNEPLSLVKPE
jgi:hypothetical protein